MRVPDFLGFQIFCDTGVPIFPETWDPFCETGDPLYGWPFSQE